MKITTQRISIEGTVGELVTLLQWISTQSSWRRMKDAEQAFLNELDDFEKKYPEFFVGDDKQPDTTGDELPGYIPPEEDAEPVPEPGTLEEKTDDDTIPVTVTYRRKKPKDMERSKKAKAIKRNDKHRREKRKVDVKVGEEWHTFDSVSDAAKFMHVAQRNLSTALNKEHETYKGIGIRYHISDNPDQPELDACLAEIEARNKEPYQTSKP